MYDRYDLRAFILDVLGNDAPLVPSRELLLVGVLTLLLAAYVCSKLYAIPPNYRNYDPNEYESEWQGIRGLLIVLAIIVAVEPLRVMLGIAGNAILYTHDVWTVFATPGAAHYNPWFSPFILFTLVTSALQLAYVLLVAIAFIRRKRIFRALAIWYLVALTLICFINDFLMLQIFSQESRMTVANFESLTRSVRALQAAIILIPYLYWSRRVHATFR
jgi:hypothetical protein